MNHPPESDLSKPQSFAQFLRSSNCRDGMLQSTLWGLFGGPLMSFTIQGGLYDPYSVWQEWRDEGIKLLLAMCLVGGIFAATVTFHFMVLRYVFIPRLCGLQQPVWRFAAICLAGILMGAAAIYLALFICNYGLGYRINMGLPLPTNMAIGSFLGLMLANMFVYFHENQVSLSQAEQRKAELLRHKMEAELMHMNMRIRPHFFFNTLNTLAALIDKDRHLAQEYLADLADLFRQSFALGQSDHACTWAEERALLERYLDLERMRFGDKLQADIQVTADPNQPFPAFLLQPLVENAIQYGISKLKQPGLLEISGGYSDGTWRLAICNPCQGQPEIVCRQGHALGLVQDRLALMEGTMQIDTQPGRVCIHLEWSPTP